MHTEYTRLSRRAHGLACCIQERIPFFDLDSCFELVVGTNAIEEHFQAFGRFNQSRSTLDRVQNMANTAVLYGGLSECARYDEYLSRPNLQYEAKADMREWRKS